MCTYFCCSRCRLTLASLMDFPDAGHNMVPVSEGAQHQRDLISEPNSFSGLDDTNTVSEMLPMTRTLMVGNSGEASTSGGQQMTSVDPANTERTGTLFILMNIGNKIFILLAQTMWRRRHQWLLMMPLSLRASPVEMMKPPSAA